MPNLLTPRLLCRLTLLWGLLVALWAAGPSHAARVQRISPQGEVAVVRQVRVDFLPGAQPLGDSRHPAPFSLRCNGQTPRGEGYWSGDAQWLFDLAEVLPAGQSCQLLPVPGWKARDGSLLDSGPLPLGFATGGPAVADIWPEPGNEVEEDGHFLLRLTGPVQPESLATHAWCELEGVGDRVPVRPVEGPQRQAVVKAQGLHTLPAHQLLLLACSRPLAPGAGARLVWDAGMAALNTPTLRTRVAQRWQWKVRQPLLAEYSCERERAHAPCMPLRPITLRFSAPVPREQLAQIQLRSAQGKVLRPVLAPDSASLDQLQFAAPLPLDSALTLHLPASLRDDAGRALANASSFPMALATGPLPPLAKFASAPFGILEAGEAAVLPLTVRQVGAELGAAQAQIRVKRLDASHSDAELLHWLGRMQRYHESSISAQAHGLPRAQWQEWVTETDAQGRPRKVRRDRLLETRAVSLLAGESGLSLHRLPLNAAAHNPTTPAASAPPAAAARTEVMGLPLPEPGYHLVELESRLLGRALLAQDAPMYVRTGVLVTPLGLHFKNGRDNALVWVTSLGRAEPVADAEVAISNCRGETVWQGRTNAQGMARVPRGFDTSEHHDCLAQWAWFVSARKTDGRGHTDLAFLFSDWYGGIEPWRFNQPMASGTRLDARWHTVLDRSLLRAGDTVSMKHFARQDSSRGLRHLPSEQLPDELLIRDPDGHTTSLPLRWSRHGSAHSQWQIPPRARLGRYQISLRRGEQENDAGEFRVEAFRVPLVDARFAARSGQQIAPAALTYDLQLNYNAAGPLAGATAQLSALLRERSLNWPAYPDFSFHEPTRDSEDSADSSGPADDAAPPHKGQMVAQAQPLRTDAQGAAQAVIRPLPSVTRPMELLAELSFTDPNGEVQTVSHTQPLWPAALVVGLRARHWAAVARGQVAVQAVVLDTQGRPLAGRSVSIQGRQVRWLSSRKRLVGGFYAYEQHEEGRDLGVLCSGQTDAQGLLDCDAKLPNDVGGELQLLAAARDDAGRSSRAGTTVWIQGQGDGWFVQHNDDRIDIVPEQRELRPGQTARLQVRMPFRQATALVTVEREGIVDARVLTLRGDSPVIELPIPQPAKHASQDASWAPNVYVSVLVLRGRVRELPWTSFFQWGWRSPVQWWQAWRDEGPDWQPPTALVDLAKPSFKLGVTELRIGADAHRLTVTVQPERSQYATRQTARVTVSVSHQGQPVAGGRLAFAAVDEALLALRPNTSWDLLEAMLAPRGWGVETATAQGEIIGRRHHGQKAVPAGGGGGHNPTRELFDTLLLWRPEVTLNAQGQATLEVPLNDALSRFRLVAIADADSPHGPDRFGTGQAVISVSQDLQILSGLPPTAREGDRFDAGFTLRNTTAQAMTVEASLGADVSGEAGQPLPALKLPTQRISLPAGAAHSLSWPVTVPAHSQRLRWLAQVRSPDGRYSDRLALEQTISPVVPVRIWQSKLLRLEGGGSLSLPVAPPSGALPQADGHPQGGVQLLLRPSLAGPLPGVERYFRRYPFQCLEQRASRAVGLNDTAAWAALMQELPSLLDADGLARYYPAAPGEAARGSDSLSAYLLRLATQAGWTVPAASRERLLNGLQAFVEGRIERHAPAPRNDLDVRKLAALVALAEHGRALPRHLGSLRFQPETWPTAALLDSWVLLRQLDGVADRPARLQDITRLLRARLQATGNSLQFSTEDSDRWDWLMDGPDANAARLVLAALDQPDWRPELPQLLQGLLGRQQQGAWDTTTANAWGSLAVRRFAQGLEASPVTGSTVAQLGDQRQTVRWPAPPAGHRLSLPWPATSTGIAASTVTSAPAAALTLSHQGQGSPWLQLHTLAAVALREPVAAGYTLHKELLAVQQQHPGRWSRGDVLRVRLTVEARADAAWVAISDPLPTGATVLGSGLGRDSQLATQGEATPSSASPRYIERSHDSWRAVHEWLPRGRHVLDYTLRLNQSGQFALPPTRVEALYAPARFAEWPNPGLEVR